MGALLFKRLPVPAARARSCLLVWRRLIAESLRDNVHLEALFLSGNPFGDVGIAALARAFVSRKTGRNSALRKVYLVATSMTDAGAALLQHALEQPHAPALDTLALGRNPGLSVPARRALEAVVARRSPVYSMPADDSLATGIFYRMKE